MNNEGQKVSPEHLIQTAAAETSAKKRLAALFDNGTYNEVGKYISAGSDLAGAAAGFGYVNGTPVYAFAQDRDINSGAVSAAQAEKICRVLDLASRNGVPVVGIYDSCGGFIGDRADVLNAYGRILSAVSNLSGVVPQISVVCGVCAGSAALIAASADFVVMTEEAELYTALGAGSGSAKEAAASGTASIIAADDADAFEKVRKFIAFLPQNNLSPAPEFEYSETGLPASGNAEEIAAALADDGSLTELSAAFGKASYTAIASAGGSSVGIAAVNKTDSKLTADDCAKLARFVRFCDAFSLPIVTVIDTEGFEATSSGDRAGAARTAAMLANAYAEATSAKITLITGKAYGSAFVALAGSNSGSDMTFAYSNAVIAAMTPAAGAEFLWHDELKGADNVPAKRKELEQRFAAEYGSVYDAAAKGTVDEIIDPASARAKIISALEISAGKRMNRQLPKKHGNMPF